MKELKRLLGEDRFGYEIEIELATWAEFLNGSHCRVSIGGDTAISAEKPITKYQIRAFTYIIKNQEQIKNNILDSLIMEYKKVQEHFAYSEKEKEEWMPDVHKKEQFKSLIGIKGIHLMNVEKGKYGYVGYEFECTWSEGNGMGIMTHRDRVTKIGPAYYSFTNWIAKEDLKSK